MSMKNPLTPAGIEPATVRFVAQHLNHCVTAVPNITSLSHEIITRTHTRTDHSHSLIQSHTSKETK